MDAHYLDEIEVLVRRKVRIDYIKLKVLEGKNRLHNWAFNFSPQKVELGMIENVLYLGIECCSRSP